MNFDFCNLFQNADKYDIFYYGCLLLSALIGLYCIKKVDTGFKWLALLVIIVLVSEIIAKYISYCLEKQNNIVYHIFTPIEYTFYIIIFTQFLGSQKKQVLLWLSVLWILLLEIMNTFFFQPLDTTPTNVYMVENVFLVFLSLLLFLKIRDSPSQGNLLREGVFWFNSAVLCYYAFSTLHWGLHNMALYRLEGSTNFPYDILQILSGILYLSFSTAILLNMKTRSIIPQTP